MIFLQTGQEVDIFNLLIDICPGAALLVFVGAIVAGIVVMLRRRN